MEILQPAQDLVQEHFDVVSGQVLRGDDDFVQIRLEQLRNHVAVEAVVKEAWFSIDKKDFCGWGFCWSFLGMLIGSRKSLCPRVSVQTD